MGRRERALAKRRKAVAGDVVPSIPRDLDHVDEGPSSEDLDRFGGVTQPCPECGQELFDDVAVCWHCGHALTTGAHRSRGRLWTGFVVALIVLAFVLIYVL